MPQAIDHNGPRERPFGKHATGFFFAGHGNGRCPPGPVHQRGGRADCEPRFKRSPGVVARRGGAPTGTGGLRQVFFTQGLVLLKAAGAKNHATASLELKDFATRGDLDPRYPITVEQHVLKIGVEP